MVEFRLKMLKKKWELKIKFGFGFGLKTTNLLFIVQHENNRFPTLNPNLNIFWVPVFDTDIMGRPLIMALIYAFFSNFRWNFRDIYFRVCSFRIYIPFYYYFTPQPATDYTKNQVKIKKILEKKAEIFLFFLAIVALFILILNQL
jgi:hypothetical protein